MFNTILVMTTILSSLDTAPFVVPQLLLSTYCREVGCLQFETELTDLRFVAVQKPGYPILFLQVDLLQELGAPAVVVVALFCL
jgi:hypothetical protein